MRGGPSLFGTFVSPGACAIVPAIPHDQEREGHGTQGFSESRRAGAVGALAGALPAQGGVPGSGDAAFTALLDELFFARLDLSPRATANGFDKDARALLKSRLDDRSRPRWTRAWPGTASSRG
jgi:hypothetical protein